MVTRVQIHHESVFPFAFIPLAKAGIDLELNRKVVRVFYILLDLLAYQSKTQNPNTRYSTWILTLRHILPVAEELGKRIY